MARLEDYVACMRLPLSLSLSFRFGVSVCFFFRWAEMWGKWQPATNGFAILYLRPLWNSVNLSSHPYMKQTWQLLGSNNLSNSLSLYRTFPLFHLHVWFTCCSTISCSARLTLFPNIFPVTLTMQSSAVPTGACHCFRRHRSLQTRCTRPGAKNHLHFDNADAWSWLSMLQHQYHFHPFPLS